MKTHWYAVVKFSSTEEIEAVPLSWIRSSDQRMLCAWPPRVSASRVTKAVIEMHPPQDDWEEYDIVVIRKCGKCESFDNVKPFCHNNIEDNN